MLQHVSLEVTPALVDREIAFLALLGFREIVPPSARLAELSRWVEAEDGSAQQLHLMYAEEPTVMRPAHIALVRPAYELLLDALRGGGFEVLEREPHWGSPRAFTHSPTGHRVEVMQFAPPRA
ncbi:MAG: hypothetical protein JWM31_264 [Solirubrobacterales bacterium]|nr:hypothetical protein [Solirubrobacterales bacterium]